jgi:hypothetical protein
MWFIPASMASHYAMAADSCQPVFDALTKVVTTPSHSYTTHTAEAAHGGTEKIYVDGKIYIRASGKWMQSPVTIAEVLEQEKENEKQGKSTCNFVRNDFVGAEPAMVYSMHRETDGSKEDDQIWIFKTHGKTLARRTGRGHGAKCGQRPLLDAV